jgi:hypothetical protein
MSVRWRQQFRKQGIDLWRGRRAKRNVQQFVHTSSPDETCARILSKRAIQGHAACGVQFEQSLANCEKCTFSQVDASRA